MDNSIFRIFSTQGTEPQPQDARRVRSVVVSSITLFLAGFFSVIAITVFLIRQPSWQLYAALIGMGVGDALVGLAVALARRGQVERAASLMIGVIVLVGLCLSLTIKGLGIPVSLAVVLALFQLGSSAFETNRLNRIIVIALVSSLSIALIEVLFDFQLHLPGFQNFMTVTVYLVVAAFLGISIRQFSSYPLFAKLLLVTLVVTLVPLTVVSYVNNLSMRRELTDSANASLMAGAQQTAQQLDAFLENRLKELNTISELHSLKEFLAQSSFERPGSETERILYSELGTIQTFDPDHILSVTLFDRYGRSIAATVKENVGHDASNQDYFKQVMESGAAFASPVKISQPTGKLSIYFSAPVHDDAGKIVGVLSMEYDASILQSIIKQSAEAFDLPGGFAVLYDENFIRLAHSDTPEYILKSVTPLSAEKFAELQATGRLPAGTVEELSSNLPDAQQKLENVVNQPYFQTDYASTPGTNPDYAVGLRLSLMPWTIAFVQPSAAFLAPAETHTRTNLLIALVVVGLVSAAAFFISRVLANPIVSLTAVAQQIAGGDMNARATVTSTDEIGTLGETFNTMTARLRDAFEDVRRRSLALQTSAEVSRRLSAVNSPRQLAVEVVEQLQAAFHYYHAHIYFVEPATGDLVMAGGTGEVGAALLGQKHRVPKGRGLVGRAAEANAPVLVSDVSQAIGWMPNPLLPDTRSEIAIPIVSGRQVLGVLDVQQDTVNSLGQDDVELLQTLAGQIAISLQNARIYEETRARADLESKVNAIGQKIQHGTSVEDTLQTAIRALGQALGAPRVRVSVGTTVQSDDSIAPNQN